MQATPRGQSGGRSTNQTPRSFGVTASSVLSSPLELKEGLTAIGKSEEWFPGAGVDGEVDLALVLQEVETALETRRQECNRRQLHLGGHTGLRHLPELPVCAGTAPNRRTVSLQRLREDTRDWRKLPVSEVRQHFSEVLGRATAPMGTGRIYTDGHRQSQVSHREEEGMLVALAIGSLQACGEGSYWSPSFQDPAAERCSDVRMPASRAFLTHPDISRREPRRDGGFVKLTGPGGLAPLNACLELASKDSCGRVALVHFEARGDPRACCPTPTLGDFRQTQLYTRTSFLQALSDLPRHVHGDPARLLSGGAVLLSTDVTVLRGPLEDGAPWLSLEKSTRIDVITVSLVRHPQVDDQGQYTRGEEKALVAEAIDGVFAVAVKMGVDALVFPPLGAGGVLHPAADAGDLVHKAAVSFGKYLQEVRVCEEFPGQLRGDLQVYAAAVEEGRKLIKHKPLVSMAVSPYIRPGWKAESAKKLSGRKSLALMQSRMTFLAADLKEMNKVEQAQQKQELRRDHLKHVREENRLDTPLNVRAADTSEDMHSSASSSADSAASHTMGVRRHRTDATEVSITSPGTAGDTSLATSLKHQEARKARGDSSANSSSSGGSRVSPPRPASGCRVSLQLA